MNVRAAKDQLQDNLLLFVVSLSSILKLEMRLVVKDKIQLLMAFVLKTRMQGIILPKTNCLAEILVAAHLNN